MDMKRLVLISLLAAAVGVMAFLGCERPEPIDPTEGQPQSANEDSLINQQSDTNTNQQPDNIKVEHWGAVRIPNDSLYTDSIPVFTYADMEIFARMDIYIQDSVLYAINLEPTSFIGGLMFGNGCFSPYSMRGDTITVHFQDNVGLPDDQKRWIITRWNDTIAYWDYFGISTDFIPSYIFYLEGVER